MPKAATRPRQLNPTAASLLGFLHDGPMSGWDLVATAQRRIGDFWTVTQSQVYRELATMTERGLVTKGAAGARDRTPFTITEAGRKEFAAWIAKDPGSETIRFPLLLTLSFGQHIDPPQLRRHIRDNRTLHQDRLDGYLSETDQLGTPFQQATLLFGIEYERAVLRWFDELPELLGLPSD